MSRKQLNTIESALCVLSIVKNYNAGEGTVTIYTRDPAVMRKVDALVNAFPTVYKLIRATDYDRTVEMPKSYNRLLTVDLIP